MKIIELYEQVIKEAPDSFFYHGSPYLFDRFDINKVGSGDGLSIFGYGLYFTDDISTAMYYAKELSKGENRKNGFNIYTVRLFNLNDFYDWEDPTPDDVAECVIRRLMKMGKREDAQNIIDEHESYGVYWELRNMYGVLEHILGNRKDTTEFLSLCGVGGVIGMSPAHRSKIYTVYDDSNIRITEVNKMS